MVEDEENDVSLDRRGIFADLGVFMPAAVLIPSFVRFRYRKIRKKTGKPSKKPYDHVWFENSATASGLELAVRLKREEETKNGPAVSERADYK